MNQKMEEKKIYAGINRFVVNGELVEVITITASTEEFTGEFLEITSDSGEGSFADVLQKLMKGGKTK